VIFNSINLKHQVNFFSWNKLLSLIPLGKDFLLSFKYKILYVIYIKKKILKETTLEKSFCLIIGIMFFTSLYSQEIDLKKQAIDEFENENYPKAT